jgi:hemerythrin-like domain-containing protein
VIDDRVDSFLQQEQIMEKRKSAPANQPKAIAMLANDHRNVRKMFKQFEKMKDQDDSARNEIIEKVCQELTIHTKVEEELFYPFARERLEDGDLLDEAEVEHQVAKDLIAQLQQGTGEEAQRDASMTVLGEYVSHHIDEEEKELFPKLTKVKGVKEEMQALGEEMEQRKLDLADEQGIGEEVRAQMEKDERAAQAPRRRTTGRAAGSRASAARSGKEKKRSR